MGFAMWFDAIFETNNDKPIVLSTSPELTCLFLLNLSFYYYYYYLLFILHFIYNC